MADPVVVLFGGTSRERRVSVASAQHLAEIVPAVDPVARWWFWAPSGGVVSVAIGELTSFAHPFETDFDPVPLECWSSVSAAVDSLAADSIVVLALHGGDGENGAVQRDLERAGVAFTGSGSAASELAFDKDRARAAVRTAGLTVAEAVVVDPLDPTTWEAARALQVACGQVVIKPVADGSSFGLRFVTDTDELMPALEELAAAAVTDDAVPYLVERYVVGRELTIGVVEQPDGSVSALPASEVILEGTAFDFDAKYLGKGAVEVTPADIDAELLGRVQAVALAAHSALGCRGYSRTDVIVDDAGGIWFLETNTLPGLTKASFMPQQLGEAGITMADFLRSQVELARRRDS